MLGLEAEAGVLLIDNPLLAGNGAVEEVAAVELDAGLVRIDLKLDAGLGQTTRAARTFMSQLLSRTQLWS